MYVFICSVYLNQPPKLEPAEFVKPCVILVYVVNTYGLRLGLVYTVAVPCTSFFVAVCCCCQNYYFVCSFQRNVLV